ncbi:YjgB family protein [Paenibacillus segetis]|uniref:DUF4309 domain-containing protein n=1 Tax=Paenibacillus segetis TaxID=1325360 RepID=A0ABQ1YLF6_9BACL|nr:YjgB family protein [Paenibacillus segetis]GGH28477.1 hypothetical protein GCM10008013_30510 [Paenibacillus segetis]
MRFKQPVLKITMATVLVGVVAMGGIVSSTNHLPTSFAATESVTDTASEQALKTLNSFYKPALKGQFPGSVSDLTIGESTREDVFELMGEPYEQGDDAESFIIYHAEMGHPGYAFLFKLDKIREMRYFGTNVERGTNIGGITKKMLFKNWYAPDSRTTIKNGKVKQTKITYLRGDYKLEFIFNSSTDLDHINLLHA